MATAPAKPQTEPAAKVEGHKAEASPQPEVRTIADEQRERSEEMQRDGIDAWKAQHDERGPDDKPKQVPGVAETTLKGNSTPEARTAQHPAAPR